MRVRSPEVRQRVGDGIDAVIVRQEALAQRLELVPRRHRLLARDRGDGRGQMVARVNEVEDLRPMRQRREVFPVVAPRVRDLGESKLGTLRENVRQIPRQRLLPA